MNSTQLVPPFLTAIAAGVIALLQYLSSKADRRRGEQLNQIHAEIRAVRSDLRVMDADVRKHSQLLGGLAASDASQAERISTVERDVKQIVREGCARRRECGG